MLLGWLFVYHLKKIYNVYRIMYSERTRANAQCFVLRVCGFFVTMRLVFSVYGCGALDALFLCCLVIVDVVVIVVFVVV